MHAGFIRSVLIVSSLVGLAGSLGACEVGDGAIPDSSPGPGQRDARATDGGRRGDAGIFMANAGIDRDVLAGLTVPLDGSASIGVESVLWEQIEGPTIAITDSTATKTSVNVPAQASAGTHYVFRLSVGRDDGALTDTDEVVIDVHAPQFETFIADQPSDQLGGTEGIAFDGQSMWVVSTDGFASAWTADGAFEIRHDLPNGPVGANFDAGGNLVVADHLDQALKTLDTKTGDIATVTDSLAGGGALGAANYPLPDKDGNIYVSTRESLTVLRYDAATGTTVIFWSAESGDNPNAMAFGPEPDVLYVGLVGRVVRIPIEADGSAGPVSDYVTAGSPGGITYEIDGLTFDSGKNLWIGCPNAKTLFVAPYRNDGSTVVSRTFTQVNDAVPYFVNVRHGTSAFGATTLYWTNLGKRSVGRIDTGLSALVPVLAVH